MMLHLQRITSFLGSSAKYIVRLDDACETQDAAKWSDIERILDANNVKPLVAVIPCNEDPALFYNKVDPLFWSKVKRWEKKGWTIGQHGFKHHRHLVDKESVILPLHNESEFAGLSYDQQCGLIHQGYSMFRNHGISPLVWIAPCHTYDINTIRAIKAVTEIKIASDGIACYPFTEHGLEFLPQQLWWPQWRPLGVWTICLHPSNMSAEEIERFARKISAKTFRGRIIDPLSALDERRDRSYINFFYKPLFWLVRYLREGLRSLRKYLEISLKSYFC